MTALADLTAFDGTLYFTATDGSSGLELYKSDGTESGTTIVQDINSGSEGSDPGSGDGTQWVAVDGYLYFAAYSDTSGIELWRTDGSTAEMVKDIAPGSDSSSPEFLAAYEGELYFSASSGSDGDTELWKTDGTEGGTKEVKEIGRAHV